ncbi:hypothetical protein NSB04_05195 [Blautia pseudococcoides]|nr:hypothetical protein [Blautia pseudococcoides]
MVFFYLDTSYSLVVYKYLVDKAREQLYLFADNGREQPEVNK